MHCNLLDENEIARIQKSGQPPYGSSTSRYPGLACARGRSGQPLSFVVKLLISNEGAVGAFAADLMLCINHDFLGPSPPAVMTKSP